MKKLFKLMGIVTFAVALAFSFGACGDSSDDTIPPPAPAPGGTTPPPAGENPFIGVWDGTDNFDDPIRITFTATQYTLEDIDYGDSETGSYTRNGDTATFTYDGEITTAVIANSIMTVTSDLYGGWIIVLTKTTTGNPGGNVTVSELEGLLTTLGVSESDLYALILLATGETVSTLAEAVEVINENFADIEEFADWLAEEIGNEPCSNPECDCLDCDGSCNGDCGDPGTPGGEITLQELQSFITDSGLTDAQFITLFNLIMIEDVDTIEEALAVLNDDVYLDDLDDFQLYIVLMLAIIGDECECEINCDLCVIFGCDEDEDNCICALLDD